jgi:hypothetical protein
VIEQILNRRFVLQQMDAVVSDLRVAAAGDGERHLNELASADYSDAARALERTVRLERRTSSGQHGGFEASSSSRRGGRRPAPLEDLAFVSRDRSVSLVQSVLEEHCEAHEGIPIDLLTPPASDAWFWGHEHRCMTFEPHLGVRWGRLIGHGGVPVYMSHREDDPIPAPGSYEYRAAIDRGLERWAKFGFCALDFDGSSVCASYIDEDGQRHLQETIG